MWSEEEHGRLCALLETAQLPLRIPGGLDTEEILEKMLHDKKVVGTTLRFVLPERMGAVTIREDVPGELIRETIEEMK